MGDRLKLFWLGVFVLTGIVIASWLLMFLKPSVGDGKLLLTVRFSNIDKISIGTRVTFGGKPVGEVKEIREIIDSRHGPADEYGNLFIYELVLKVDSSVQVFTYDEINFATSGLLGEKSIAIIPKSTPFGAPPAQEVTHDILYARSIDKLEATMHQVADVAKGIENTMEGISQFLTSNSEDIKHTFKSFSHAAEQADIFLGSANNMGFVEKATTAFSKMDTLISRAIEKDVIGSLHGVVSQVSSGEGTLGKLFYSDSFYLQLADMMCKIDMLISDINNYGFLFRYDRGWQRAHKARMAEMQRLSSCGFSECCNEKVMEINASMDRVCGLLNTLDCQGPSFEDTCFAQSFRELLSKVEAFQSSLKIYTEMLAGEYCQQK